MVSQSHGLGAGHPAVKRSQHRAVKGSGQSEVSPSSKAHFSSEPHGLYSCVCHSPAHAIWQHLAFQMEPGELG